MVRLVQELRSRGDNKTSRVNALQGKLLTSLERGLVPNAGQERGTTPPRLSQSNVCEIVLVRSQRYLPLQLDWTPPNYRYGGSRSIGAPGAYQREPGRGIESRNY